MYNEKLLSLSFNSMLFEYLESNTAAVLGTQLCKRYDSYFLVVLIFLLQVILFFLSFKLFGNVLEYKEENTNHHNIISTLILSRF